MAHKGNTQWGLEAFVNSVTESQERNSQARALAQIKKAHKEELARLQKSYRIQTENVAIVKRGTGSSIAQTQTAIDLLMESTGKSFEEIKDLINKRTLDSKCNQMGGWFIANPELEKGRDSLIGEARAELLRQPDQT